MARARFTIYPPEKTILSGPSNISSPAPQLALSPDGRAIVFTASTEGSRPILWLRMIEETAARPLPGTENAEYPFWSPDSRWVVFKSESKLKEIPISGGPMQALAEGYPEDARRRLEYGRHNSLRNSERGTLPRFLLFNIRGGSPDNVGIFAGSLDAKTRKFLPRFDTSAIYASPGYLVFMDGDTLLGQPFDADRLQLSAHPFMIAERIGRSSAGYGSFSVAGSSALAYAGRHHANVPPDLV